MLTRDKKSDINSSKIKDCTQRFILLKLTTDRLEASRGLFATVELLVMCPLKG